MSEDMITLMEFLNRAGATVRGIAIMWMREGRPMVKEEDQWWNDLLIELKER
jgi:hypothetical protein